MAKKIAGDRWMPSVASQSEEHSGNPFWDKVIQMGQEMRVQQGDLEHAIAGAATAQEAKNLRRRLARRIIRDGYPKIEPFQTKEQIDHYLKGSPDGHTCLICGNAYRALGIHLANLHKVDLDEYRDQYRLPRTFGLACEETKALHRELLEERIACGQWQLTGTPEQASAARKHKTEKDESAYKRICTKTRQQQFSDADHWQIIDVMRTEKLTLIETTNRPGMPAPGTFRKWKSLKSDRQQTFSEVVEALPFSKQAEMNLLGERYNRTILALRGEGKTIDEIAAVVGTERMGINERLRKLDTNHKPMVRHKTHCPKGHPYQVYTTATGRRLVRCPLCNNENKRRWRSQQKAT